MKQVRFRPHDPHLVVRDLNALGEGAQVIPPIAAAFDPQVPARGLRKGVDHLRRHSPIAGAVIVLRVRDRLGFVRPVIGDNSSSARWEPGRG
ncbi:hypothetical protein [Sphingomonas sp. DC2300-3]|uniref:hypothetical protein n=1 Tax=unclassified Sphingomonas TaxID=196159 RepID=UPI003CF01501